LLRSPVRAERRTRRHHHQQQHRRQRNRGGVRGRRGPGTVRRLRVDPPGLSIPTHEGGLGRCERTVRVSPARGSFGLCTIKIPVGVALPGDQGQGALRDAVLVVDSAGIDLLGANIFEGRFVFLLGTRESATVLPLAVSHLVSLRRPPLSSPPSRAIFCAIHGPDEGERRHAGEGSLLEAPRSLRTWWYLCGYTLATLAGVPAPPHHGPVLTRVGVNDCAGPFGPARSSGHRFRCLLLEVPSPTWTQRVTVKAAGWCTVSAPCTTVRGCAWARPTSPHLRGTGSSTTR